MPNFVVGKIEEHDVIYVSEKDVIFCKNTTVSFPVIARIIKSSESRDSIPEKKLDIHKDGKFITFGCLHTTIGNCKEIEKQILKIKKLN